MAQYPNFAAGGGVWTLEKQRVFQMGANWPGAGDFQSLASTTVGVSGSAGSITFSSIPSLFKHLQVRVMARTDRASTFDASYIYFNGDTTLSNYSNHGSNGDGATANSFGYTTASAVGNQSTLILGASATAGIFGAFVLDIYNYTNTNQFTTTKTVGGVDLNGSGRIQFNSGTWFNTSAVTSITFTPVNTPNFTQYSSFALYGIKG